MSGSSRLTTSTGDIATGSCSTKCSVRLLNKVFGDLDKMTGGHELRVDAQPLQESLGHLRLQARRIKNHLEPVRREVQTLAEARDSIRGLSEAIHQLGRVSDGIQQSVMDKRMIDELSDPLVHMVRNSADHGIESPEQRRTRGKPPQGTIALNAFHRGNCIVIQVSDDGKGLDKDRILAKCLQKGMLTQADADNYKNVPGIAGASILGDGHEAIQRYRELNPDVVTLDLIMPEHDGLHALHGIMDFDPQAGS